MDSRLHAEIVAHRAPTGPGPLIASSLRFMHQRRDRGNLRLEFLDPQLSVITPWMQTHPQALGSAHSL